MLTRVFSMMVAMLLTAAASAADIRVTADPDAKLAEFRTFTIVQGDAKAAGAITDKRANDRLRHMIAVQLNSRGYTPAKPGEKADLGVLYSAQTETAKRELMTGRPGVYEYRGRPVELGGISTMEYRKGTLIVDLFDAGKKALVWRATISDAFTASYSEENWKKIERDLGEAFKKLPSRR